MSQDSLLIVVLAAGKGTRMKSDLPKVLHPVAGLSMLGHVLKLAGSQQDAEVAIVVGPNMDAVAAEAVALRPGASVYVQENQLGTADAVLAARPALEGHRGPVVVLYADTPLIQPQTLSSLRDELAAGAQLAVLGFEAEDPTGYGRLLTDQGGALTGIREEKDASEAERAVRMCNSGVMGFAVPDLLAVLDRIGNDNAKGEFYLTDAVEIVTSAGGSARIVQCDENEVLGVNSRDQLAVAEALWQQRARFNAMRDGVSMQAPETVFLAHDTKLGRDVTIEPHVVFGAGVEIGDRVTIKAFSHLEGHDRKSRSGVMVGEGTALGPFARLRPGTNLGRDVHIGNFVELKNARMGDGAKANHLSYVGDGDVGEGSNIGAGTIFCNYDGVNKAKTTLGAGVFIGSNSALVAPVTIGAGAYVAAGSTITRNVPADALGIERAKQELHEGWAAKYRLLQQRRKDQKSSK